MINNDTAAYVTAVKLTLRPGTIFRDKITSFQGRIHRWRTAGLDISRGHVLGQKLDRKRTPYNEKTRSTNSTTRLFVIIVENTYVPFCFMEDCILHVVRRLMHHTIIPVLSFGE